MSEKTRLKFYWADVFATESLGGNPLPVVVGADALDEATMKRIAREFNQAETTFVLKPSRPGATHRLRSFTAPGHEVFGALDTMPSGPGWRWRRGATSRATPPRSPFTRSWANTSSPSSCSLRAGS
jgi:trans-2,3-dihydro-3-hydroxyanthranilate isomerase